MVLHVAVLCPEAFSRMERTILHLLQPQGSNDICVAQEIRKRQLVKCHLIRDGTLIMEVC